ncbi:unnamed protein product [Rotaria magnacalcarata]|uniref:Uncharacterized protein n=1 Tax=Rotaria magnacalcarata TaxID=392030 RepID=A0A816S7S0_9BILA|nr:unnamed protein product [Rotaria magnacalcarata]CAF3803743.1 unnamed protein product [Rotaria magnacalcarata]
MDINDIQSLIPVPEQEHLQQHKHQLNSLLLHPFQPLRGYTIYTINGFTSVNVLISLIDQAKKAMTFSIYTERDYQTSKVTTISIELLQGEHIKSSVLTFDLLNQPDETTCLFSIVKFLLLHIFKPEKRCFIWNNDQQHDLYAFVDTKYLPKIILESIKIIQLQQPFKDWYNKTFQHQKNCFVRSSYKNDSIYCNCPYRPYKNINDEWSLMKALNHVFNEFFYIMNEDPMDALYNVKYSVICCLIITKLSMVIELNWTKKQLYQFKKFHQSK